MTKYKVGLSAAKEKKKAKEEAKQEENTEKEMKQEKPKEILANIKPITPLPADGETYTPDQIAKLIADFTKQDPYNLKGLNPAFRYRFINRQPDKLDRQTMRGWAIVTGPEAERIADNNKVKLHQGQIIVGDGVLAKIPMEVFIAVRKKLQDLNNRMIGKSSETLRRDMGSKYSRNVEESLKVRDRGLKEVQSI